MSDQQYENTIAQLDERIAELQAENKKLREVIEYVGVSREVLNSSDVSRKLLNPCWRLTQQLKEKNEG